MTYCTLSLARNSGDTSPVNAPLSSQWQCWAPTANGSLSMSITVCTLRISVNGGWMLTSTLWRSSLVTKYASFCTVWMASKWLRFIFQLPEINGLRIWRPAQRLEPRKVTELEQFERRPASRRDVVDLVIQAELGERSRAVATPDDGERLRVRHSLGDGAGPRRESRIFEHAHRSVPEDGASVHDHIAERGCRTGTDVETLGAFGKAHTEGGEVPVGVDADEILR